jgi:hypothetical protein
MTNELDSFLDGISTTKVVKTKPQVNAPTRFKYHPDGWILPNPARQKELAYIATLSEDTCAGFNEWKECGYWILKGSKSYFQDALGTPQFTIEQVKKSNW